MKLTSEEARKQSRDRLGRMFRGEIVKSPTFRRWEAMGFLDAVDDAGAVFYSNSFIGKEIEDHVAWGRRELRRRRPMSWGIYRDHAGVHPVEGYERLITTLVAEGRIKDEDACREKFDTRGLLVSFEFEFLANSNSALLQFNTASYLKKRGLDFVSDISVAPSGNLHRARYQEARITVNWNKVAPLYETAAWLRNMGGGVNTTCGLHVHIDSRHLTKAQEALRRRRLVAALPWFLTLVPPSRRANTYCWPNHLPNAPRTGARYKAINPTSYRKHGTTEIRLGSGTLDADKALNWARLLKYVADAKKYMRTFDDFLKSDAPESLKVWAIMRRDALRSSADGNGVVVGAAIEEGEEVTCV